MKKLEKRKRRLQRRISKKYSRNKKGVRYCKTRNITKSERKLLKVNRRLTNIRHSYLHLVTSEIVNREPKFIVLEDLNVNGMMKNKHLARAIQEVPIRWSGIYAFGVLYQTQVDNEQSYQKWTR